MMPPHDAASYLVLGRVVFREEEGSQPRLDLPQQEDGAAHARGPPDPAVEETKRAALRIERRECLEEGEEGKRGGEDGWDGMGWTWGWGWGGHGDEDGHGMGMKMGMGWGWRWGWGWDAWDGDRKGWIWMGKDGIGRMDRDAMRSDLGGIFGLACMVLP